MPSKVILIVIEFMFLGINMFLALLRLILALAYAREHKLYCYITSTGVIKTPRKENGLTPIRVFFLKSLGSLSRTQQRF